LRPLESCPVCDAPVREADARYRRETDVLLKCRRCGLLYANVRRSAGELAELYATHYYGPGDELEGPARALERKRNRILYRTVLRDLVDRYPHVDPDSGGPRPRVLDYGCGPGYFLAECRELGFETVGIELSAPAARYAREQMVLDVRESPDEGLDSVSSEGFVLVTAWSVIEHAQDPRKLLTGLVAALAPGGVLCLTVPNVHCWGRLLQGGRWFNLRNPTHVIFFQRSGLSGLLRELGLEGITRPIFWGGRPGFGPLANLAQYLVRLAGLGSELRLYARKPE